MNNIYLIGMPGCGKTTLGRILAKRLGREFYDTDREVEESEGMSVSAIFDLRGEKYFRTAESDSIKQLSLRHDCVIATGGGIILADRNVNVMRGTGRIIFIDTPNSVILSRADFTKRPLLRDNTEESIERMYSDRRIKYISSADRVVKTVSDTEDNIISLLQAAAE